jgi:hypothetical protein
MNDKYSLDLTGVVPFSTTPRFLFADHVTNSTKEKAEPTFRFFVTHTEHPRIIVEVMADDQGKLSFEMAKQIDPIRQASIDFLMEDLGKFAVDQMNMRIGD